MSLIFDEYGRPFIILREQQQKARIKGNNNHLNIYNNIKIKIYTTNNRS